MAQLTHKLADEDVEEVAEAVRRVDKRLGKLRIDLLTMSMSLLVNVRRDKNGHQEVEDVRVEGDLQMLEEGGARKKP